MRNKMQLFAIRFFFFFFGSNFISPMSIKYYLIRNKIKLGLRSNFLRGNLALN